MGRLRGQSILGLTGAALGTGSALAHKVVDSMFSNGDSGSAPAPQPAVQQTLSEVPSACEAQAKAFTDCMSANNGDMGACQFYSMHSSSAGSPPEQAVQYDLIDIEFWFVFVSRDVVMLVTYRLMCLDC